MRNLLLLLFALLNGFCFSQIKPSKLVGSYYGERINRMPYKEGEKKTIQPNREVKLFLKKNKKCTFKTSMFTSQGTWEISADSILTCTFKNEFGEVKSREESVEVKTYKVDKNFVLIPVQAKTGKLYKR